MSDGDDRAPGTLRCRLLGHKWSKRVGIGRLWDVCVRCNRSRIHHQQTAGGEPRGE